MGKDYLIILDYILKRLLRERTRNPIYKKMPLSEASASGSFLVEELSIELKSRFNLMEDKIDLLFKELERNRLIKLDNKRILMTFKALKFSNYSEFLEAGYSAENKKPIEGNNYNALKWLIILSVCLILGWILTIQKNP